MFIGIFGYLTALEYTSATDAALLSPLQPVFAVILGIVVGLEQASVQRVGGVLLCTVGSMTVTVFAGQEDEESAPQPLLGMAMLMACAVANATMFLAQKKLRLVPGLHEGVRGGAGALRPRRVRLHPDHQPAAQLLHAGGRGGDDADGLLPALGHP